MHFGNFRCFFGTCAVLDLMLLYLLYFGFYGFHIGFKVFFFFFLLGSAQKRLGTRCYQCWVYARFRRLGTSLGEYVSSGAVVKYFFL